jgi:hypothetical protein
VYAEQIYSQEDLQRKMGGSMLAELCHHPASSILGDLPLGILDKEHAFHSHEQR